MTNLNRSKRIVKLFKQGIYYIGDPCFVVELNEWTDLVTETGGFTKDKQEYNGHPILIGNMSGMGNIYKDDRDRNYYTTSGSIGIIPIDAIKYKEELEQGNLILFPRDFMVTVSEKVLIFGDIKIKIQAG